jgi:hypothetical protein
MADTVQECFCCDELLGPVACRRHREAYLSCLAESLKNNLNPNSHVGPAEPLPTHEEPTEHVLDAQIEVEGQHSSNQYVPPTVCQFSVSINTDFAIQVDAIIHEHSFPPPSFCKCHYPTLWISCNMAIGWKLWDICSIFSVF